MSVEAMLVIAAAFALVNGTNTGGTMLSLGLSVQVFRPLTGVLIATLGVASAPLIFGTAVAETVVNDLVVWDGDARELGMMLAVIASVVVVWVLSRAGAPTGLTLALIGALAGVGQAAGEPIGWRAIGVVLAMTALAPVVGGLLAAILVRAVAPLLRTSNAGRALRVTHAGAYGFLSLAYGANDAQKMLAVMVVAGAAAGSTVPVVWWHLVLVAVFFGLGTAIGLGRMMRTIGSGVLPVRALDAVSTQVATAAALMVSSAAGAPVGLAQTISGALIGSGASQGLGRVRWRKVGTLMMAWVTTLPAAYAVGVVAGQIGFRA